MTGEAAKDREASVRFLSARWGLDVLVHIPPPSHPSPHPRGNVGGSHFCATFPLKYPPPL
jgi:hypothetical protein